MLVNSALRHRNKLHLKILKKEIFCLCENISQITVFAVFLVKYLQSLRDFFLNYSKLLISTVQR